MTYWYLVLVCGLCLYSVADFASATDTWHILTEGDY